MTRAERERLRALDEITIVSDEHRELRIQRDKLIREHPGTLREIAQAAGLSFQQVGNIRNRKEEKK